LEWIARAKVVARAAEGRVIGAVIVKPEARPCMPDPGETESGIDYL